MRLLVNELLSVLKEIAAELPPTRVRFNAIFNPPAICGIDLSVKIIESRAIAGCDKKCSMIRLFMCRQRDNFIAC